MKNKKENKKYPNKKRNYLEMEKENSIFLNHSEQEPKINICNKFLKLDYTYTAEEEYEINNLTFSDKINKPDSNKINQNMTILNENIKTLNDNIYNSILDENVIYIRKMFAGGNCFFRSVSFF